MLLGAVGLFSLQLSGEGKNKAEIKMKFLRWYQAGMDPNLFLFYVENSGGWSIVQRIDYVEILMPRDIS